MLRRRSRRQKPRTESIAIAMGPELVAWWHAMVPAVCGNGSTSGALD